LDCDPALRRDTISHEDLGYAAMRDLIESDLAFDAVFAASDLIAIGAMRALVAAGRAIPGDVAVMGFDDLPAASMTNPPLTTVMQDLKGAGERLVETLVALIEDRPLPEATLGARLVARRSTLG